MHSSPSTRRFQTLATAIVAAGCTGVSGRMLFREISDQGQVVGRHPELGLLTQHTAVDLDASETGDSPVYLALGRDGEGPRLEWSIRDPYRHTGWFYVCKPIDLSVTSAPRTEVSKNYGQFAPCRQANLLEVGRNVFPETLYGPSDQVAKVFGSEADERAIPVTAGDVIFARTTDARHVLWILELTQQEDYRLTVTAARVVSKE